MRAPLTGQVWVQRAEATLAYDLSAHGARNIERIHFALSFTALASFDHVPVRRASQAYEPGLLGATGWPFSVMRGAVTASTPCERRKARR